MLKGKPVLLWSITSWFVSLEMCTLTEANFRLLAYGLVQIPYYSGQEHPLRQYSALFTMCLVQLKLHYYCPRKAGGKQKFISE